MRSVRPSMNAVLNYTGSVAAGFPMGIDMDRVRGCKWHLRRYFCNYRIFSPCPDVFCRPRPLTSICGSCFLSETVTLGNRFPIRPLRRSGSGCSMLSFQFVGPMFGRSPAVEHEHRYQNAFFAPRASTVQNRRWLFFGDTSAHFRHKQRQENWP